MPERQESQEAEPRVPKPGSPLGPERARELALGLARIFAIVPLYPAEHELSRAVGEKFLEALHAALPEGARLSVETLREELRVHGQAVRLDVPQIQRLHHDLGSLGVASVSIDPRATPADLHRFATVLLDARRRVGSAQGFQQLELAELPENVRVVQREFGRRGEAGSTSDRVTQTVERILDGVELEQQDAETQKFLRSALERLFGSVVETLAPNRPRAPDGQAFTRSLDDVLQLGVHAMSHALQQLASEGSDPTELRSLFEATEKALAISEDRVSVEILLSVLSQAARELAPEPPPMPVDDTPYALPIPLLRTRLADYGGTVPALTELERGDGSEAISILLHLLRTEPPAPVQDGALALLERCISEATGEPERKLLAEALRALADDRDSGPLDLVLPSVTRALRRASVAKGLAPLWTLLLENASAEAQDALWPHAVNELLLGTAGGGPQFRRLLLCVAGRQRVAVGAHALPRLLRLDAVRHQQYAAELFDPPQPELFAVFAALLAQDSSGVGLSLLDGFRRHPPRWPGAEVLFTYPGLVPACRGFLFALLRTGSVEASSPALEEQARRGIATALRGLRPGETAAAWAPGAIAALGSIGDAGERPLLREIRRGFRLWPFRRWPQPCREAAAQALRTLRAPRPKEDTPRHG